MKEIVLPDDWHIVPVDVKLKAMGGPAAAEWEEVRFGTGWVDSPAAVTQVIEAWEARSLRSQFPDAAPALMSLADDDAPVFLWRAEEKVLGKRLPTWNQKSVGSCVGFGATRAAQDLMLVEIASGEDETYPGAELCPEITYAGSRVEIGGGRIRGDGSIGAWAADLLMRYGLLARGVYGSLDLTTYSESLCRLLGARGIPDELEPVVKLHPVRAAAMVQAADEFYAAIGGGKPVFLCSSRGFTTTLEAGFCKPSGRWDHCMTGRGRFKSPHWGRSGVIGNSWADYLTGDRRFEYIDADGKVKVEELPPGHFCAPLDVIDSMCRQRDSFALAGLNGWKPSKVDYTP